mmetsp:Transcript_17121/g.56195  ORF Transcript_17121/g.56195 Transcript_17121/m.56195 type:complete len:93 (+) Transcript_17121:107-385(+)
MQMLQSAKGRIERGLAGRGKGGGYASLAHTDTELEGLGESFYEQQLQRDGWHLDEVEDDDDLDFTLPSSAPPPRRSACGECISRWTCGLLAG